MKLSNIQYENIKQVITDIIFDYDLKYPINIFDLAEKMDFTVIPYSFFCDERKKLEQYSKDGFNYFNKSIGTYCIYYNDSEEYKERIIFTIAHEIGHIVLNCNDNSDESNSKADFFAAYLLAPAILIIDKKFKTIEEIKKYFGVGYKMSKNSLNRAIKRETCNIPYTKYEKFIIQSQK